MPPDYLDASRDSRRMHVLAGHSDHTIDQRDLLAVARATLDDHWAVTAVPPDRRRLLLERADEAAVATGEGLGEPIADGLALLGTAYELAALAQLGLALDSTPSAARDLARAVLTIGASRAYRCGASLRAPVDGGEASLTWALRLGALAMVSGDTEAYAAWWQQRNGVAGAIEQYAATLESLPWEPYARGTLWLAWLGLLGAPLKLPVAEDDAELARTAPQPLVVIRTRLAAFRERRATHGGPGDGTVHNAAALRARMVEFAIRHLADATELLTVAVLRRTLPDVSGEFKLRLSAARSAMAGDHGQDVLLAWMQAAGVTLAGGVTAQLELPGF
jgi:hypothetical protein